MQKSKMTSDVMTGVKHLPRNDAGRDFLVGDLHGCRSYLEQELEQVNFDPSVDRVISVGDLVDRGPEPLRTLALLREPWFHAVMANHEAMMLTYMQKYYSRYHRAYDFIANGGTWIQEYEGDAGSAELSDLIEKSMQLPLVLVVDADIPYNVTHGDLTEVAETQIDLEKLNVIERGTGDNAVWSRFLIGHVGADIKEVEIDGQPLFMSTRPMAPEMNLTYVGHTIVKKPVLHNSHFFIDQGAYQRVVKGNQDFKLTLIDHKEFAPKLMAAARQ